jgi:membrane protein DedA with SNARE-associated domain
LLDSVGVPLPAALDTLLIYIAVKTPHRAYFAASLAVAGSFGGNLILFEAARYGVRRFLRAVPEPGKPQRFRRWFHRYGLVTVFIPAATPFIPLPLKVFVISAGAMHTPLARFLAVILLARFLRYFGDAYLGIKLGRDAEAFLRRNAGTLIGSAVGLAAVFYLLIRINDRRSQSTS